METKTCGFICPANDSISHIPKLRLTIRRELEILITKNGVSRFLSGMNLGGDLLCADIVLELKQYYPNIQLEAVFPYENQAEHWTEMQRDNYYEIASQCDYETLLQYHYDDDCIMRQREYIANSSNLILSVCSIREEDHLLSFNKDLLQIDPVKASSCVIQNSR